MNLTDNYGLSNIYTGNVFLNHKPKFIKEPAASVTVYEGGKIEIVEYGSTYSIDEDSDPYFIIYDLPLNGIPVGFIISNVSSTNIMV